MRAPGYPFSFGGLAASVLALLVGWRMNVAANLLGLLLQEQKSAEQQEGFRPSARRRGPSRCRPRLQAVQVLFRRPLPFTESSYRACLCHCPVSCPVRIISPSWEPPATPGEQEWHGGPSALKLCAL